MKPNNPSVDVVGTCDWWASNVRSAKLVSPAGDTLETAVVLGPEMVHVGRGEESDAVERARERSRPWIGRQQPGVLTLLSVERVMGRVGWVYEPCGGVSLGAALRSTPGPLPQRIAAEVVACCADLFEALAGTGELHPGVDPDDVLLLADGTVKLAGFVGPAARSPVHRDPRGTEDAGTAVWRLGVLLAQLLTGAPPSTATDRVAHELMLRRLLIKIMSRPGPMFPERFRDWQCAMLSWSPEDRPMVARIAPGLREIATALAEPDLLTWSARWVPEVRKNPRSADAPPPVAPFPVSAGRPGETRAPDSNPPLTERTEEITLAETPLEDDVTAISTDGDPPRPFASPEHGTIPVHVGPPPEAVPKVTALPEELFGTPLVPTDPETPAPEPRQKRPATKQERQWRGAAWIGGMLALVALVLVWYLWV